jgi:hypothetical protein
LSAKHALVIDELCSFLAHVNQREKIMKSRLKEIYATLGRVLNDPRSFGLNERIPRSLEDALTKLRQELIEELRDETPEEEFLETELSQDADCHDVGRPKPAVFPIRKTGT